MMKKILEYFISGKENNLYERQRSFGFVVLNLAASVLLLIFLLVHIFNPTENVLLTVITSSVTLALIIFSLFLLRKKGIRFIGNVYTVVLLVVIATSLNLLDIKISPVFKIVQGFYTALVIVMLGALFASRKVIVISIAVFFFTALHVYLFSLKYDQENIELYRAWFYQYEILLVGTGVIVYFASKFAEEAINAAKGDARIKEIKNQELKSSDEEIRASNEELRATSDALVQSNEELTVAKKKAEESNRLKTLFLANISHEIRTPMNGIIGFAKLLNNQSLTEEKRNNYTNIVIQSSEKLLKIIDDILEVSLIETKKSQIELKPVNLNQLLKNLMENYQAKAEAKGIELKLELGLDNEKSLIYIDDNRLLKILSNLVDNGVKFTRKGYVELSYRAIGKELWFCLKDTGIGLDEKKMLNIFDRFVQADETVSRDFGGLGLGLAIAKENVELLGGELIVQSEKKKGAAFTFNIPYKVSKEEEQDLEVEAKLEEPEVKAEKTDATILVAEDEEVNFFYLGETLKMIHPELKILHAANGQEAIDCCKERTDIDLVLMDIKMPVVNGLEATMKIRELFPDLKIVAQTAYSTEEEKDKTLTAGCNDFITKPISYETLKEVLDKYLFADKKQGSRM